MLHKSRFNGHQMSNVTLQAFTLSSFVLTSPVFVKDAFVFDVLYLCSLCCAPGDPGEGAWYHSRWKLRFGLWPPIRTRRLPCRVRGDCLCIVTRLNDLTHQHTASAAVLSSPPVTHALCAKLLCAWVLFSLLNQWVTGCLESVFIIETSFFFFYPWGVSFETICNTLLWWILHSLIHSVQTVRLSLSILICRGTATAPLGFLGARI